MNDLIDNVYLPDFDKRQIRDSDAYQLLKDNNKDTSVLEGYENTENIEPIEFPVFNSESDKTKFIEENAASTASTAKDYLETFGNILTNETEDFLTSMQLAAVNGADVAVNLMPLAYKMFESAPIATALPKEFFNQETEGDVMRVAKHYSDNLGEYRQYLFDKQKDNGWVKDILSLVVQDSAYSIPAFNMMRKAGVPKYPAFFLSAAFGAVGVENVDRDGDKTYFAPFQKDVQELKRLIGILPDTPADKIADEVHQALEYGTFGAAIPGIIDAFKFMKQYIPAMAGTTGASVGMFADNEAEGSPIKAIVNAVNKVPIFKSTVRDVTEKKITKGNAEQIYNTIKNTPGVKEAELKWLGLEDHLKTFGKGNKQFTQEEVLKFIDNNRIDVSEVMFGGPTSKISTDLAEEVEFAKNEFERKVLADVYKKDPDMIGEVAEELLEDINYDVYRMSFDNDPPGTMDFNTLQTLLGDNPDPSKLFKKELVNGKYEMMMTSGGETLTFGTSKSNKFYIDPMEFEKFTVEQKIRKARGVSNAPKFRDLTEPGGEDYTELVFKIKKGGMDIGIPVEIRNAETTTIKNNPFRSPNHMNVKNEIAHVRFKTREIPGPRAGVKEGSLKVLTVEEMQSDFNIRAAKENRVFGGEKPKIADFPFKNTWYEMTIRRLIRYAADNGFDAVAIPKAKVPAKRYRETINKIKSIQVDPFETNTAYLDGDVSIEPGFAVKLGNENGETVKQFTIVGLPGDAGFFGELAAFRKDVGEKNFQTFQQMIVDATDSNKMEFKELATTEVVGSGKGKFELYDKAIPAYMKKYAKKWNAKVYDEELSMDMDDLRMLPVTVLELSDEMKTGVQSSSQPLFELLGGVSLSYWGAEAVSDSMENNTISQMTN